MLLFLTETEAVVSAYTVGKSKRCAVASCWSETACQRGGCLSVAVCRPGKHLRSPCHSRPTPTLPEGGGAPGLPQVCRLVSGPRAGEHPRLGLGV